MARIFQLFGLLRKRRKQGKWNRFATILVFLSFQAFPVHAFKIPPVITYDPSEYHGGNQNWMIDQMAGKEIMIANGEGLLVFNGAQWQLFNSHRNLVIRSLKIVGETIYTGSYMDFGKWSKLSTGEYTYQSLLRDKMLEVKSDEQFWNIIEVDNRLLFQSLYQLYLYDPQNDYTQVIEAPGGVNKIFKLGLQIYFQSFDRDLFKLVNGEAELYISGNQFPESEVIKMFSTESGIKLITQQHGFYSLQNGAIERWIIPASEIFELGDIFSAVQLRNGNFALGTITRGVYVLDPQGHILEHIDQLSGLSNNTVLSLFEDRDQNLWLGLDNGINVINLNSPFAEYVDKAGRLGTVYTSVLYQNQLYIGTNQGLFYQEVGGNQDFRLVKNSNGQVWSLYIHDGELFCGHNLGTYLIRQGMAIKIANELGTWKFESIPSRPDLLMQGNYEGLHVLKKNRNKWEYGYKVQGVDFSMRQFVLSGNQLIFYHPTYGLFSSKMDEQYLTAGENFRIKESIQGIIASLVQADGRVYFKDESGLYQLIPDTDQLIRQTIPYRLSSFENASIPTLVGDEEKGFWLVYDDGIVLATPCGIDSLTWSKELPVDHNLFKTKQEFENISRIGEDEYLVGLTSGYTVINFKFPDRFNRPNEINISTIQMFNVENQWKRINLNETGIFKATENNIVFDFNVPNVLKYQPVLYQYWLEGDMADWSEWTEKTSIAFYKLKPGNHTFRLRAKVSGRLTQNEANYSFRIKNYWYFSAFAYAVYLILLLLISLLVNYFYRSYFIRKQELILEKNQKELHYVRLQSEQEVMKARNEQLKSEIEAKNKELAVTAMSLVKKNEFLIETKDILRQPGFIRNPNLESVIDSINKEIENEESWEMLKDAFENVDKDFIKKVLSLHPGLTPNDLKLCTYLRLNLNSKEIASLMNISVRSMETKRYRLRKKMGLEHDTNLVEYILSV